MAERERRGYFVSSKEIPAHTEEMGIWVPWRLPRKLFWGLQEIARRASLREGDPERLKPDEANRLTSGWLLKAGVEWNWKDGDGSPLPQPVEHPEVLDEISEDEMIFIIEHITDATRIPPRRSTV